MMATLRPAALAALSCGQPQAAAAAAVRRNLLSLRAKPQVRAPAQHGLSSNKMALITSGCGAMRSPSIKRP